MLQYPTDLGTALSNLDKFKIFFAANLPESLRDQVIAAGGSPSPVDTIVLTAEALYAGLKLGEAPLPIEALEIGAQLIQFATAADWHGLAESNRGGLIQQAFLRELEQQPLQGTSHPSPDDDPEPLAQFVPPPPAPEPEPPIKDEG